jgi:glyoxylase I family protein
MLKQIAHVCILSADLKATEHFYCELLGLSKLFNFDKDGRVIGFYLGLDNRTSIEVFENAHAAAARGAVIDHLCLEVDDIAALIAHLRSHDIAITDKKLGCDHTWQAWVTDPGGVRLELFEYTPESSQFTGADCLVDW